MEHLILTETSFFRLIGGSACNVRGVKRSGFFVVWGNVGQGVCLQSVTGNVR